MNMKLKLLKKDLIKNRPYYLILLPIVVATWLIMERAERR